jgi:hypothetical protein
MLNWTIAVTEQDVWLPDLRGIPIGREGQIVAEFSVASAPASSSKEQEQVGLHG